MAASTSRWSARVTRESHALDLEPGVFTKPTAREVALSLRRSAERSTMRKSGPYRSAMSMLTFYIKRAGTQLTDERLQVLKRAKDELRALYGKAPAGRARRGHARKGNPRTSTKGQARG